MPIRSLGTTLTIGTTTVGGLTSIGGVELSADTIDVTTLDSDGGYREFINGFVDGGEVTAEGYMDEKGTDEAALVALVGGNAKECVIQFPKGTNTTAGPKWEFSGVVTGFSTSADLEDPLGFSITVKVSGKPTFTPGS